MGSILPTKAVYTVATDAMIGIETEIGTPATSKEDRVLLIIY